MMLLPAHKLMQRKRHFVRVRCAPNHNALQFQRIVGNGANFNQFRFDDLGISHSPFRMAHPRRSRCLGPGLVQAIFKT